MDTELTSILCQQNKEIGALIEDSPGFRIGDPEFHFTLAGRDENRWTHISQEHSLKVESEVQAVGSSLVIAHRLENTGSQLSPPINVLDPLHLVFRHPFESWRHVFANGASSAHYYPPTAFRTHERSRSSQELTLESHPDGRSSILHLPFLISLASTSEDTAGFFVGMEWSASWRLRFGSLDDKRSSLALGIKVNGLQLEPGESLNLPPVHLGFFTGGAAAGTNALRRYFCEQVCARYQGELMIPRVSYDHWFYIKSDLNLDLMKVEARRAAELGGEVFVVDAAWFPGGYHEGIGNWHDVDRDKFRDGLEPLAEYVRELDMDFGLWFEPEEAAPGTTFVQEHPDWFIPITIRAGGKQFYHLNLALRDAQDYLIEMIGGWIQRLDLRWTRWDYGLAAHPFWDNIDPTGKLQFRYLEGLYRVLDTLIREHPNWMIESCSGGGCRIDLGTMKRAHTFWISDATGDPLLCRYLQARANRFLPGHLLNSSVAVHPGQGDSGFNDTAVLSRMLGKLAFDGDIASWSPDLTARMACWVDEFKAIRHLLAQDFYQLLPMPMTIEDWDAVQFVSYSGDASALFIFAGSKGGQKTICPQGLRQDSQYLLSRRPDGEPRSVSSSEMLTKGIPVELGAYEGGLWYITAPQ